MSGTFLQPFLESIQTLPCNLKRNFNLIGDLDEKANEFLMVVDKKSEEYLEDVGSLSPTTKSKRYDEIKLLFDKAANLTEEKKQLAQQAYNIVDKQIQQLDIELAKFGTSEPVETDDIEFQESKETIQLSNEKLTNRKKKTKTNKNEKSESKVLVKNNLETNKKNKNKNSVNDSDSKESIDKNKKKILITRPELCLNMEIDPNEPRYCICHQVSYGDMVGCDGSDCPIDWFHFSCVDIKVKPKGKWYCPDCSKKRKMKQQAAAQ